MGKGKKRRVNSKALLAAVVDNAVKQVSSKHGDTVQLTKPTATWGDNLIETKAVVGGDDWDTMKPTISPKTQVQVNEEAAAREYVKMNESLDGWPWMYGPRQPVTIAPFCINETSTCNVLSTPPHSQAQSQLMRLMSTGGVNQMIIDLLSTHHSSLWKFAFSCQKAYAILTMELGIWDLTNSWFDGCENEPSAQVKRPSDTMGVRPNLIVTHVRSPTRVLMDKTLYESSIWPIYQLCQTVRWRGEHFRRIHLYRIPFLTVDLLDILIPSMRKLEVLGVYQCPLIHVGHGMKLLKILLVDRGKDHENRLSLDFYPRLHVGPAIQIGNPYTVCGFGATWDNWEGETDRAIWSLVFSLVSQAKRQGIDLLASHSQFRKWLDDGPCWDVEKTLNAMSKAFHFDYITSGQTSRKFKVKGRPVHHDNGQPIKENEFWALYPELTQAILLIDQRNVYHEGNISRFFAQDEYKRPEGCEWMFYTYKCTSCMTWMPGVFFQYRAIKNFSELQGCGQSCLGCMLGDYLDTETDHFKREKNKIMDDWITDHIGDNGDRVKNTNDIVKLLDDFGSRGIIEKAARLDFKRAEFEKSFGYDRETQELQKPVTDQVVRSKRGAFLSAPTIGEKEEEIARRKAVAENPDLKKWSTGLRTRHLVHHRHYG